MRTKDLKWEILGRVANRGSKKIKTSDIVNILLKNRGLKTEKQKAEFFNPTSPYQLKLADLNIEVNQVKKALKVIKKAIRENQQIVIFGDYDADGICATAILWETLYSLSKNVYPYLPDRFEEGYGINLSSIENLKSRYPQVKLIITVDNGIVAYEAVDKALSLGLKVIITDHHQKQERIPKADSIIHTNKISGSAIAWILSREIKKEFGISDSKFMSDGLDLVAIGTVADQMSLIQTNRSFAKHGLFSLNNTKRIGLLALLDEAGLVKGGFSDRNLVKIGTYEVGFIIAPRINAMGRVKNAIDSLRLLCTRDERKAYELASLLGRVNQERQRIVDEVLFHVRGQVLKEKLKKAIIVAHERYHEGVIGLAASKLVEEFWRPTIVFSKGEKISKASARSISGFNIIESIRKFENLILGGGGHPMAAGFSIETSKLEVFKKRFEKYASELLDEDLLRKKLYADLELDFDNLSLELCNKIDEFEPTGLGNPAPLFVTRNVRLVDAKIVGSDSTHLRLFLENNGVRFEGIAFGMAHYLQKLEPDIYIDVAYNLSKDIWNGNQKLQLKVKDLRLT